MQLSYASVLLLASGIAAAPTVQLEARGGAIEYDPSCNGAIPAGSKYPAAGFKTMEDVVKQTFTDAQTLASKAQGATATDKGFSHYFTAAQLPVFHKMMEAIATPGTDDYSVKFVCVPKLGDDVKTSCGKNSIMVTDSSPGGPKDQKVIEVCPRFFTSTETEFLLYDEEHKEPSPPYKDDTDKGWCAKARPGRGDKTVLSKEDANKFVTAGHSLLHELTHLDALGKIAGVPENKNDDGSEVQGTKDLKNPSTPKTAREVLTAFKPPQTPDNEGPTCNAESFAAAATEIYFEQLCKFDEISPRVD